MAEDKLGLGAAEWAGPDRDRGTRGHLVEDVVHALYLPPKPGRDGVFWAARVEGGENAKSDLQNPKKRPRNVQAHSCNLRKYGGPRRI